MNIIPIERITDWEKRLDRQDAFWEREIIDRPVICMEVRKNPAACSFPESNHKTLEQRWIDPEFQAQYALANVRNTYYMGDALPSAVPNLGPDFFSACYGGELRFMEDTSYIDPFLPEWPNNPGELRFRQDGGYFSLMEQMYETFLDVGRGVFYTGWPDMHPGGDCLVGFRGPLQLNYDVIDNPEKILQAIDKINRDFLSLYEHYYTKLTSRGQAVTGWPGIVSRRKWHVPSNDFSCMISNQMFEKLFLDGLIEEMMHMEKTIYHLDGPRALHHLDTLLSIRELDAIQWVYGAGNGRASDHIPVYQKIQTAGKGIQISEVYPDEIDILTENLDPRGVWMKVLADTHEEAGRILKKISAWRSKK